MPSAQRPLARPLNVYDNDRRMEIRALGPLEVRQAGTKLPLGTPQQRALLALLLVHAPAVVPVDRIIDELWGASPAARAPHAVQVHISALRKLLGAVDGGARIVTQAPGYALELDGAVYDATRFEELVDAGRAELTAGDLGARDRLREALGLWRGTPFAGLEGFRFIADEAARLQDLRLAALDERIAADLALGDHQTLVPELEGLVRAEPFRETFWLHLLTALYRAGRQADALAAYQRHRRQLADELGLAPGPRLRGLEASILAHDLPEAPGDDRGLPVLPGPLALARSGGCVVGRDRSIEALRAAWSQVPAGAPLLRLVTGEAGIGKSRLVAEFAHEVAVAGAPVLYGACFEEPRAPYGPFVEALGLDTDAVVPGGEVTSPEAEQLRLLAGFTDALGRAAGGRGLLVIEDLHWAASATLTLLGHVMRTSRDGLLIVATCRDVAPDLTPGLRTFLADLQRRSGVERLSLSGLTAEDVAVLLRDRTGSTRPDEARIAADLHQATDGSPLFLRELLRDLPPDGTFPSAAATPTIRDHVAARFAGLPVGDGDVLDMAAVLGVEFEARLVAQALGREVADVLEVLERAEDAAIVVGVPGAPGRFAFTHAVLREVRHDGIPAGARIRLHRSAGRALRVIGGSEAPVGELARHFCAAATLGDARDAFRYAREAGVLALEGFASADAAEQFERAERAGALLPDLDAAERCALAVQRGEALHRAGDPRYRAVLLGGAAVARRIGDGTLLTRAALALNEQGWSISSGRSDDAMLDVARQALLALPQDDLAGRARLTAMLAAGIHLTDRHGEARTLAAEALGLAREAGDPSALGEALITAHWACFDPVDVEQRLSWAQEAREIGERYGNPVLLTQALRMLGQDRLELADLDGARVALRRAYRIADELDVAYLRVFGPANMAALAALEGRLDDAERLVGECVALARRIGIDAGAFFGGAGGAVMLEHGAWEQAVELTTPIVERTEGMTAYRASLAMLHARLGQEAQARHHLHAFTSSDFSILPRNIQWTAGMVMLADAAMHLSDLDAAARIRELLVPVSGRTAWAAFTALWPVDLALAQLSVVLGEEEDAVCYLDAAASLCEELELPQHRVRVALHRAWAARRFGRPDESRDIASRALPAARGLAGRGPLREVGLLGLG